MWDYIIGYLLLDHLLNKTRDRDKDKLTGGCKTFYQVTMFIIMVVSAFISFKFFATPY